MQGKANLARPAVSPKVEQVEALTRAVNGQSLGNYPAIFAGFVAKGIQEAAIKPRENVFTYQAWRALGRQVRRGEHGVKVVTFVEMAKENKKTGEKESFRRPWTTTVFHISQTDEIVASRGGAS
jgi:antirestriction protein ArdC